MADVGQKRHNSDWGGGGRDRKRKSPLDPSLGSSLNPVRRDSRPAGLPFPPPPPHPPLPLSRPSSPGALSLTRPIAPIVRPSQNFAPKPGQAARREIDVACAKGDTAAAFAAFDAAVRSGEPLQPRSFNVLLHLCSGGSTGGNYKDDAKPPTARRRRRRVVVPQDAVPERANAIFNKMVAGVQRTEMPTALARIEAASDEPKGMDVVKRLIDERLTPKLERSRPRCTRSA